MSRLKERSYWVVIGLLAIAFIGTLTAWRMELRQANEEKHENAVPCEELDTCEDIDEKLVEGNDVVDSEMDPSDLQSFRPIAMVNGEVISLGDFYQYAVTYFGGAVLDQMINEQVVNLEVEALGIEIQEDAINWELEHMQRGYDSEEEFYLVMREQLGMDKEDLLREVEHNLKLEAIATYGIQVSDAEYLEYVKDRPIEVVAGMELRLQQIIVDTAEEAEVVLNDLNQGVSFEDLAAAYSNDEMFPNGDLGWVEWNDPFIRQELLEAAKNLQLYEWSGPLALSDGTYGFVKLQDQQILTEEERDKLMQRIRKEIALSKARPFNEIITELRLKYNVSVVNTDFR